MIWLNTRRRGMKGFTGCPYSWCRGRALRLHEDVEWVQAPPASSWRSVECPVHARERLWAELYPSFYQSSMAFWAVFNCGDYRYTGTVPWLVYKHVCPETKTIWRSMALLADGGQQRSEMLWSSKLVHVVGGGAREYLRPQGDWCPFAN